MTNKTKVTPEEVSDTMKLAQVLLTIATSKEGPVGLTALIMATAVGGVALGVPLENLKAIYDKSVDEVYANHLALNKVN